MANAHLSSVTLCWVFICSAVSAFADQQELKERPGETVLLQCQGPRDSTITLLEWIRPDLKSEGYVFFYRHDRSYENYQHPSFHGRVELRDESMKDQDVSVMLKNITDQDTGTYECRIISTVSNKTGSAPDLISTIILKVTDSAHTDGSEDGGHKAGGNKGGHFVLTAGLIVGVFAVAGIIVGVMICRKRHSQLPGQA